MTAVARHLTRHRCYGLVVESEIPLPDLGVDPDLEDATPVDVTIRTGRLDPPPPAAGTLALRRLHRARRPGDRELRRPRRS
jgi:hypothetical protein